MISVENYRTVYSYIINRKKTYNVVYIDEALMMHPGVIGYVMLLSSCKKLILLGDKNQIPFVNRTKQLPDYFSNLVDIIKPTTNLNVSYRCPVDISVLFSSLYDEGMISTSPIIYSRKFQLITSLSEVPKVSGVKYLFFFAV